MQYSIEAVSQRFIGKKERPGWSASLSFLPCRSPYAANKTIRTLSDAMSEATKAMVE